MSTFHDTVNSQSINDHSQVSFSSIHIDVDQFVRSSKPDESERHQNESKFRYCNQSDCLYRSNILSNFRKHLRSRHQIETQSKTSEIQLIDLDQLKNIYITIEDRTKKDLQSFVFKNFLDK
jgi:hypothetical protein